MLPVPSRQSGLLGLFNWAKSVVSKPILDGRLIKDVALTTSATTVNHGLNRTPVGVIVVKNDTAATYTTTAFTSTTLQVTASTGTPTVTLWVF